MGYGGDGKEDIENYGQEQDLGGLLDFSMFKFLAGIIYSVENRAMNITEQNMIEKL